MRRRVGSCLRMRVGSCLRVQVGVEGASGDVCHVREFTPGAGTRPRRARCLVCLAQRCVTSDAPTGSPSLANWDAAAALAPRRRAGSPLEKRGEEGSPSVPPPPCLGVPAPFLPETGSPRLMSLTPCVFSGRGKVWGGGFSHTGDLRVTSPRRHGSLDVRTCETRAETWQLSSCNAR